MNKSEKITSLTNTLNSEQAVKDDYLCLLNNLKTISWIQSNQTVLTSGIYVMSQI